MESRECTTKPVWISVWRWSAAFACIGLIPGHIYTGYELARGYNTEFWALFLLLGSLGGTLAAIIGTITGIIQFQAWKSLLSWLGFLVVIPLMLIGQVILGVIGLGIYLPSIRGIAVATGGYLGGCIGVWIVPVFVGFLHRSLHTDLKKSDVSDE